LPFDSQDTVLIASSTKPQDDHRIFEKWGLFFSDYLKKKTIIFAPIAGNKLENKIDFIDSNDCKSLYNRFLNIFLFFKTLYRAKPSLVMICNFELLLPAYLYAKFCKSKTVFFYDVVENYRLNLVSQSNYGRFTTFFVLKFIQLNEWFGSKFIKHFFYSDAIYKSQLRFLKKGNASLIENLYSYPFEIKKEKTANSFLITGTLSKSYGLYLGLEWIKSIKEKNSKAIFYIVGHLTDDFEIPKDYYHFCHIEIKKNPLSHSEILKWIAKSETLLLPYHWSQSFKGCTPVKLLEAIELETKVICTFESSLFEKIAHPLLTFVDDSMREIKQKNIIKSLIINDFKTQYYQLLKAEIAY
jgi:hypothetical protein